MTTFDPSEKLKKVSGADYLEVKWRVFWFREEHPDGLIETQIVEHGENFAVFKATVTKSDKFDEHGTIIHRGGSASGYGSETYSDFRDYLEKAETKAIGRALAMLGYGTQFAHEIEDGSDKERPVDSPVKEQPRREATRRNAGATQAKQTAQLASGTVQTTGNAYSGTQSVDDRDPSSLVEENDRKALIARAERAKLDESELRVLVKVQHGLSALSELTLAQARATYLHIRDTPIEALRAAIDEEMYGARAESIGLTASMRDDMKGTP